MTNSRRNESYSIDNLLFIIMINNELDDQVKSEWPDSNLVKEVIKNRQAVSENCTLAMLLSYYKSQVSELEIIISDLKAPISAQSHELVKTKSKLNQKSQSNTIDISNTSQLLSSKSDRNESHSPEETSQLNLEIITLQIQIEKEKALNKRSQEEIERLKTQVHNYEKTSKYFNNKQDLVAILDKLTQENEELKAKLCETQRTNHKTNFSSEVKSASILIEDWDSVPGSTPRSEGLVPEIKDFELEKGFFYQEGKARVYNPEPPRTRCELNVPRKVNQMRTKFVICDLTELMKSPLKYKNLADYCPSFKRKFK